MTYSPSAREAFDRVYAEHRATLHTAFPARVVAYDVAAQTVDVQPALAREAASDDADVVWGYEALPSLVNVPVMWPRGGGHALTFPLKSGDWVLVVCSEQSTLLWRRKGTVNTHPGLNDPHGLNGCVALPGYFPDVQKLGNVSGADLVLGRLTDDATVRIQPDGTVVLGGQLGALPVALAPTLSTSLKALGDAVMKAAALLPAGADPATSATLKAAVSALATAINTWAQSVNVAATKVRAR